MKILKYLTVFMLTTALLALIGCASTSTKGGTGEYIDDSVITSKIKIAILNDRSLKSSEINVETYKGIVQLSGFVASRVSAEKVSEIAGRVPGVKSIKNDIRLK
jgi:osmotically-inducible protein OsmY